MITGCLAVGGLPKLLPLDFFNTMDRKTSVAASSARRKTVIHGFLRMPSSIVEAGKERETFGEAHHAKKWVRHTRAPIASLPAERWQTAQQRQGILM
jgi:hypothetical protein